MTATAFVRPLTIADKPMFAEALELLNRTQGRDLFGPAYLDEKVVSPSSLVVAAFLDGKLAGLGVADIITCFGYYLPFDPNIDRELHDKTVGSFSTLAVVESMQGKGIGQRIARQRLEWLRARHCDVILGVSWVSGLTHTSNRVFEKLGFRPVRKVEHFYRESSLAHPFHCPGCEAAPCRCAAILYRLDLVNSGTPD